MILIIRPRQLPSFTRDFTYQLHVFGLVDEAFLSRVAPMEPTPPWAKIASEARDAHLEAMVRHLILSVEAG